MAYEHRIIFFHFQNRQLNVGQCLPTSCAPADIRSVLEFDAFRTLSTTKNTSIDVTLVRPVPGEYNLLNDVKFYIIG